MSLYTISDVKKYVKENNITDIEVYEFTSNRKSVHTDFVKFIDFDIVGLDDDTRVHSYDLMDFDDYSNSIETNCSNTFSRQEFDENYSDGLLVVVLERRID